MITEWKENLKVSDRGIGLIVLIHLKSTDVFERTQNVNVSTFKAGLPNDEPLSGVGF